MGTTSERRHYDTKTSVRHVHLTLGDKVDRVARSVGCFAKNERVRRCWPRTCCNAGWKAVEGEGADQRPRRSVMVTAKGPSVSYRLVAPTRSIDRGRVRCLRPESVFISRTGPTGSNVPLRRAHRRHEAPEARLGGPLLPRVLLPEGGRTHGAVDSEWAHTALAKPG